MRSVAGLLCVALVLMLAAPVWAAGSDALLTRARGLIDAGRLADARALLEEGVARTPDDPERRFWLGVALYRTGAKQEAREAFLDVVALDPGHASAYYNLGAGYFADGMWEEAADAFLRIPDLDPGMAAGAFLNAGLARYRQGRMGEARGLFGRAIARDRGGTIAASARTMLAYLEGGPDRPGAPAAPAPEAAWAIRAEAGREYNTNVLLAPDDATASDVTDWRTLGTLRTSRPFPLGGARLTPEYTFYGLWYDSETSFDYQAHQVRLRLDAPGRRGRPRLEYAWSFAEFGGTAYLTTHALTGRLQLAGTGPRAVWTTARVAIQEAPGGRYDYLSGTEWRASLAGTRPLGAAGTAYGTLDVRLLDATDLVLGPNDFRSYSYVAAGPLLYVSRPWPLDARTSATVRYEYRVYRDRDRWTAPVTGNARRRDHRVTAALQLSLPVLRRLEAEVHWQGQFAWSNIGDNPGDYQDRDYTQNVFGALLRLTL